MGKLSAEEMVGLYALSSSDPDTWNAAALSEKYGVKESLVASILKFTAAPTIIPTNVGLEGNMPPQGVWPHNRKKVAEAMADLARASPPS